MTTIQDDVNFETLRNSKKLRDSFFKTAAFNPATNKISFNGTETDVIEILHQLPGDDNFAVRSANLQGSQFIDNDLFYLSFKCS